MQGLGLTEWVSGPIQGQGIIEGLSGPISDLRGPASGACGSNSLSKEIPLEMRLPLNILDRRGSRDVTFAEVRKGFAHTYIHCLQNQGHS